MNVLCKARQLASWHRSTAETVEDPNSRFRVSGKNTVLFTLLINHHNFF